MPTTPDLQALLPSWELALRAERKSPATIKSYTLGVQQFIAWCQSHGEPVEMSRAHLSGFVADILDAGQQAATAQARQLAVRRYAAWLVAEGELPSDPMIGMRGPKIDTKVVEPFTDSQIKALLAACAGPSIHDRRDEALIRLMLESGIRAGEVVALEVGDVDLQAGTAVVRRGKGGKGRIVPFGPQTARAIDRYLRLRRLHRLHRTSALWLGGGGKAFTYGALHKSLTARARAAGVTGFHPHRLRHTAAHRWLAAGGSEGGLMAVAGWTRPDMLLRYTKAQASARAADEARKLNLGDV